jgi:hypothetical protein
MENMIVDDAGRHVPANRPIVVEDMRDKLMTLDQAVTVLERTEPLSQIPFERGGATDRVRFSIDPGWNDHGATGTAPVDASITIGRTEYQLTYDALLEATSAIGLTKQYVTKTPSRLITPQLEYWYGDGAASAAKEMKLLATDTTALALTKGSIVPFSNLRLVDEAVSAMRDVYGENFTPLVDYKFSHSLRKTHMRLIVPEIARQIVSHRHTDDNPDNWSIGVQLKNSLVGEIPTSASGYMFAWWCTNGAITQHAASGNWSRRTGGQGNEVYDWARNAVDEILGGLEHELDAVEALTQMTVPQDEFHDTVDALFSEYKVPRDARQLIIDELVANDDLSMYGIMQAITQSANSMDSRLSDEGREALMTIGADVAHAANNMCESCHQVKR